MKTRRSISVLCVIFCSLSILATGLNAEELQLKDGTKISGRLTGISGDSFQVKTAYGDISVPRSQVLTITFPENQPKHGGEGSGAASANKPPVKESLDGTTYTNHTADFKVIVPKGWMLAPELTTQSADIIAALKSADQIYFLLVTPGKFVGTLATYKVLVETQLQTKFKEYEKVSESPLQIDGKSGLRLIWRGKNPAANDTPMKAAVYIVPSENRITRLSFLTLDALFDEGLPTFEKIAASYQSIPPSTDTRVQQSLLLPNHR
jgi:hypothetical protein